MIVMSLIGSFADIRLSNILTKLDGNYDELSIDEFRKTVDEPDVHAVRRYDDKPVTSNVPSVVVESSPLVKSAEYFTSHDAGNIMIGDFGQA
jgi:hypothetical protein